MPENKTNRTFKNNSKYRFNEKTRRYNGRAAQSTAPDRRAQRQADFRLAGVSDGSEQVAPGGLEGQNAAPMAREGFWNRAKREWRAAKAQYRSWRRRMALLAASTLDEGSPPVVASFSHDALIARGEEHRRELEWRQKTGRDLETGEDLSGMGRNRLNEFDIMNPFAGANKLKPGRQRASVEDGRPWDARRYDPFTRKFKGKLSKDADADRDEHGRDFEGWVKGVPSDWHCDTNSVIGPAGLSKSGLTEEQYYREVVVLGLTVEERAEHQAEQDAHEYRLRVDEYERELEVRYA